MVVILYLFSSSKVFFAHPASFTRYTVTPDRHAILSPQPHRRLRDDPKGVSREVTNKYLLISIRI